MIWNVARENAWLPEACEDFPHASGPARRLPYRRETRHGIAASLGSAAAIPPSCQ
jgi:hypothetical protein